MDENIIRLEDVYITYCSSKPTLYKAIVGLILTSRMTPTILSKLTLNDFLNACGDYFKKDEEKSLSILLKKDPWNMIPTWKINSENIITFSTPETTFFLFLYLKEKRLDDLDELNSPLFKSGKSNSLSSSKISSYVTGFNKILQTFNENWQNNFKSKNLIRTFDNIYDKYMSIDFNNKKNLLMLFEGKLAKNTKFYIYSNNNSSKIKEYYKLLIPFLTARTYNFDNQWNLNVGQYFDHKNKNFEMIIWNYYYTHFKEKTNLNYAQEQLLLDFALKLTKKDKFRNDERYLNKLVKKALIKLNLYYYNFNDEIFSFYGKYMEKNHSPEAYAEKIENTIDNLKINDLIKVKESELYRLIIRYVIHYGYYNKDIEPDEAEKIIGDILFSVIDKE